jgi:hypothetical protein
LPAAIEEYSAQAQQLGSYLADDLSRATAALDQMTRALDAYLQVAPAARTAAASVGSQAEEKEKEKEKEVGAEAETEVEARG